MHLSELQERIRTYGQAKGWTFTDDEIPEKLMMVVSECSEAMEDYRQSGMEIAPALFLRTLHVQPSMVEDEPAKPVGFAVELADAVIRLLHLAGHMGINLEDFILIKQAYNEQRPYRHGNKRA